MHHVKILTQSFIYVFYSVALKGSQLYTLQDHIQPSCIVLF